MRRAARGYIGRIQIEQDLIGEEFSMSDKVLRLKDLNKTANIKFNDSERALNNDHKKK